MNGWGSEGLTSDEETCACQNLVTVASYIQDLQLLLKSVQEPSFLPKKKFQEHSKIIFCALVIKTSEMNVVYGHHLDENNRTSMRKHYWQKLLRFLFLIAGRWMWCSFVIMTLFCCHFTSISRE